MLRWISLHWLYVLTWHTDCKRAVHSLFIFNTIISLAFCQFCVHKVTSDEKYQNYAQIYAKQVYKIW